MTRAAVITAPAGIKESGLERLEDAVLVRQSQSGDRDAFSELVRRHQHLVYNVSYRFMRDAAQAEDMAQEAFLKAFRLLKGFRGDCSFTTWMYRVTSSVCLTELSRRKRRGEVELPREAGNNIKAVEHAPEEADMKEQIRRCVTYLSDRYATIITLYYLNGSSYDEIAQVMDVPLGTLKTWMFRARKQLRHIVEKEVFANG
ncbi:MAG TPA: RNA polymerase sigma factor [Candidatus Hydrogenedentes bacterium]|nr:RNA polymerase sigma factor [Candidatus Hydrogenedentota bacterium]